jgi:DNA-binding transcriptional LysR family regulator
MELNYLRYFFEVAHTGNVTKAARNLRISQPSVSKIIRLLEHREGVRLFQRDRRGMKLTREGEIYFNHCQRIFAEVERLRQSVREERKGLSGELRLGASDNLCLYVLPKILKKFQKKYPQVNVSLFSGSSHGILQELREQRCELGLFYTSTTEERFDTQVLAMVPFRLVIAPALAREHRISLNSFERAALKRVDFVGSRPLDYQQVYPVLGMLRSLGLDPKARFESNQQEVQKKMVLGGGGYSLFPSLMVDPEIQAGRLAAIPLPRPVESPLLLATRKGWSLTPVAEHFKMTLTEELGSLARTLGIRRNSF